MCAILLAGALNVWAQPCKGMLTTVDGKEVFMKCHYLIPVCNCIALLCMACAMHIFTKKEIPTIPIIILGLVTILVTFPGLLGIGICLNKEMACHATAPWIRIIGGIFVLCGVYGMIDPDKQL